MTENSLISGDCTDREVVGVTLPGPNGAKHH